MFLPLSRSSGLICLIVREPSRLNTWCISLLQREYPQKFLKAPVFVTNYSIFKSRISLFLFPIEWYWCLTPMTPESIFHIKNVFSNHNSLQLYLSNLKKYFKRWGLKVNPLKIQTAIFRKNIHHLPPPHFFQLIF